MQRIIARLMLAASVMVLVPLPALAQTAAGYVVEITDIQAQGRSISLKLRVIDQAANHEVAGLTEREISVFQDGALLNDAGLTIQAMTAAANDPANAKLPFNSKQNLIASGATLGIVADISTALNRNSNGIDYVAETRKATEYWIGLGNNVAPGDPEAVGLFIPRASNDQPLRPAGATDFSRDHNLVIGALRQEAARDGATNLYSAILEAVTATAAEARRRGTPAYVVVFSDGTISSDTPKLFTEITAKAAETNTTIIAIPIGKPENLEKSSNQLPTLAGTTNGRYVPAPVAEREAAMQKAYVELIKPVDRTGYAIAFNHSAPRDDKPHTFQVKITLQGQAWESPIATIPAPGIAPSDPVPMTPIAEIQRGYLLGAIPLAIIAAAIATLLATLGARWRGRMNPTAMGGNQKPT